LRAVLPLFLQRRGTQVLHASAVRGPHGVVAFCGRAGSGKSTLAYELGRRGHELWSDDAVAVTEVKPPRAMVLGGELRLLEDVRMHLGVAGGPVEPMVAPGAAAPLAAVVVLRAPDDDVQTPATRVLEPSAAFSALVENAYVFDLEAGKRLLSESYLTLASELPVHEVVRPSELSGLQATADLVEALIRTGSD
jgi:hypothetical protein